MNSLELYCNTLYGDSDGLVYIPTKNPRTAQWKQRWFKWPLQENDIYEYIRDRSRSQEVYIAPAMFASRKVSYESVLSSRVVWAEFDGTLPKRFEGLPRPNLRIQSSIRGHEHWYWILDSPLHDTAVLSLINKKLAYSLDADKCWDVTRVLRPPTTTHHDSGKTVSLLHNDGDPVAIDSFAELESPESLEINDITSTEIVDVETLLAVYEWPFDTFDLFKKEIAPKQGKEGRSGALTRLAFDLSEMGMGDNEIVSVLKHADDRWKKYSTRTDQLRRLTHIVRYVRTKQQTAQIKSADRPSTLALGFEDFLRLEIRLDWIVKGILPVAGQAILFGAPGCGKTTLSLRTAMAVARGEDYLNWKTLQRKKVLFVSAEMPHEELQEFFTEMALTDISSLQENFFIYPIGHAFPLNNKNNQNQILEMIDKHKIEVVIFDSLSVVAGGSTNDDQTVIGLNSWVNDYIRKRRGCSVIHIHHNRKPDKFSSDYNRAKSLADLYGSVFIAANAITVIGMERDKEKLQLHYTKGRYLRDESLKVISTENRDFEFMGQTEVKDNDSSRRENRESAGPKSRSSPKDNNGSDGPNRLFDFALR